MIKCLLVTYSLMNGSVIEYTGQFKNCDNASEFVRLFNLNNTKEEVVISLNPREIGDRNVNNTPTGESF